MRLLLNAVIAYRKLIIRVRVLVKSKQLKLVTDQAKLEDRCRQLVDAGINVHPRLVSVASKGSDRLPSDIFGDMKNPEPTTSNSLSGATKRTGTMRDDLVPFLQKEETARTETSRPYV